MPPTERLADSGSSPTLPWHARPAGQVLERLGSGNSGLTAAEARSRLARQGLNRLTPPRRRSPLARFLGQFHNVLIYVLLAAAAVTAALTHWVDTGVILGVVLINALIGYLQEGKAERALEAIRHLLSPRAAVLRGGRRLTVPAQELVPGDVVLLQSGDKVPADLRLFAARNLRIDESALTGESVGVTKTGAPVAAEAGLADRPGMAFSGTLVSYGQGRGVVVATGDATELGRISAMLSEVHTLTTPLLQQMTRFGQGLSLAIGALALLLFGFGLGLRGYTATEMFMAAVGLAVAAIPEGLPAIVTITLAVGVQAMARRQAIIRRLPAVETLGSVTVICSDKTGTLTRNEMTVATVALADASYQVSGAGYDPHGGFQREGRDVPPAREPDLRELARAGLLCNDAEVEQGKDGQWAVEGDPTEGALVILARKAGLAPGQEAAESPRTDSIPFESEHRFMATLHHDHTGHGFIFLKGAPERVLGMCHHQRRAGQDEVIDMAYWHQRLEALAADGQRVLALAFLPAAPDHDELRFGDVETGLTLLGLVGMMDPPRPDAVRAVAECRSAGIGVKMVTGDHRGTARAVARRLGMDPEAGVLTGADLEGMDDATLRERAGPAQVFARVSPEHKLRLVEALQARSEVVAMTGDGVNDAPALKRADVGIAMGRKGTEVAKEAAEMVLGDDNFASIAAAIREGRTVYDNIKKSILFILPTNGAEALIILAAVLLGYQLPVSPVQILWINMITAVTLGLTLAFEGTEPGVMRRPPRHRREPLLSRFLVYRIGFVSLVAVVGTFGLFLWERTQGVPLATAQTTAVNTLVLFEAVYLLNTRRLQEPIRRPGDITGNRLVLAGIGVVLAFQALFTYAPFMQQLFGSAPVETGVWGQALAVAATLFVLVEVEKRLVARLKRHSGRMSSRPPDRA